MRTPRECIRLVLLMCLGQTEGNKTSSEDRERPKVKKKGGGRLGRAEKTFIKAQEQTWEAHT